MYGNVPQGNNYMFPYPQIAPMNQPMGVGGMTRNVLAGRMVKHLDDITLSDIPQDGSVGIFPQEDGKCIYTKTWNNMGQIITQKFVPSEIITPTSEEESTEPTVSEVTNQDIMNGVMNMTDTLSDVLNLLTQPNSKPTQNIQNGSNSNKNSKED